MDRKAMNEEELQRSIGAVQSLLSPLKGSEFSEKIYKVSVYLEAIAKNWKACSAAVDSLAEEGDAEKRQKAIDAKIKGFEASSKSSLKFARMNLDAAMNQALEAVARKPRSAILPAERKKAEALKKTFDRLEDPGKIMLEHYRSTSDPLDKYLVAGPWGHEYLKKRGQDLEDYDRELCEILACGDSVAGKVVLSYSELCRAIDAVEKQALES